MTRTRRLAWVAGLTLSLLMAAMPVRAAAPANDGAGGAVDIDAPATVSVELTGATLDGDPQYCGSGTASVWYRYTAPSDVKVTVSMAGEPWMGAIHLGVADPMAFQSCVFAGGSTQVTLSGGQALYLQVSTDGSPTSFEIGALTLLANDRFADAAAIGSLPTTVAPDLTRATGDGDPSNCTSAPGAWYALTLDTDGAVDITPGADAYVTVVGASAFDVLHCLYPWGGRQRVTLSGGSPYHLLVQSGNPSDAGTPVTIELVPPPPSNDDRSDAQVIGALPAEIDADLRSATPDSDSNQCFPSDWPSVWYRYTPTSDQIVTVEPGGGSGQAAAILLYQDEDEGTRCTLWHAGNALVRAGEAVDIGLGAPPSADPSVGMTITAAPAPTIDVTIAATGTVERVGGVAIVEGTAICSVAGDAGIHIDARQRVGRTTLITGDGFASFQCGPTPSPFSVRVPGDGAPFGTGALAVTFDASTGDWPMSADDRGTATVKLRGR
jgi:hypothetical protein